MSECRWSGRRWSGTGAGISRDVLSGVGDATSTARGVVVTTQGGRAVGGPPVRRAWPGDGLGQRGGRARRRRRIGHDDKGGRRSSSDQVGWGGGVGTGGQGHGRGIQGLACRLSVVGRRGGIGHHGRQPGQQTLGVGRGGVGRRGRSGNQVGRGGGGRADSAAWAVARRRWLRPSGRFRASACW